MKYVIVLDDRFVNKNGDIPYVIIQDEEKKLEFKLKVTPIIKPILIHPMEPDTILYLAKEHIDALCKYERDVRLKEITDRINADYGFPKSIITVEELRRQFGLPVENNEENIL